MVGDSGEYLDHAEFEPGVKKTGLNISKKCLKVLEETDSLDSLLFVASDGTAANSGVNSKFIICLQFIIIL